MDAIIHMNVHQFTVVNCCIVIIVKVEYLILKRFYSCSSLLRQ